MKNFLFIILLFAIVSVSAQDKTIHGVVTTFDSILVTGAQIKVISNKQVVTTDSLGRFIVMVDNDDKLKVFAHGFYPQKVKLNEKTKAVAVNLKLRPTEKAREYAIGYGHVKDADKLSAVAQMTNKDDDFSRYTSMQELLKGRFSGVNVMNNGDIIIRGANSIMADNSALIVIDEMIVDKSTLYSISPLDVRSINVIKDGTASIYGSRGANGVIIIETKRGGDD